jgi:FtsH-binding integral membrane protein
MDVSISIGLRHKPPTLGATWGYTVLDFNRLRPSGQESAVPIAASIFLDVLNIFLFFLQLFGGDND